MLILVPLIAVAATTAAGPGCELEAVRVAPEMSTLRGAEPVTWKVRFTNLGDGPCSGSEVKLVRAQPRGIEALVRTSVGVQTLPILGPGEQAELAWQEAEPPRLGEYRYRLKMSPKPDDRARDEAFRWDVTFSMSEPGGVCDLAAFFEYPRGERLRAGATVNITVRFENLGRGDCEAMTMRLAREGDRRGHVEDTAGTHSLPALAPGDSYSVSWREKDPPRGDVIYSVDYWGSFTDSDPFNHRPRKLIRYR